MKTRPGGSLREAVGLLDLLLIASVPAVLLGVFSLPEAVRFDYALRYTEPTAVTVYTSHFVHLSADHLFSNLLGYLLVVPLAYLLSVLAGRRGWFFVGFVTYLVAFPVALSELNVLLSRPRVGYGFSGLNMAFLGLLPVVLTLYLERTFGGIELADAPLFFLSGAALIGGLVAAYVPAGGGVAVVTALATLPYLRRLYRGFDGVGSLRRAVSRAGHFELSVAAVLVFVVLIVAAFPADPGGDGLVLNVYLHLLGYGLGFIVPYATFTVLARRGPAATESAVAPARTDGGTDPAAGDDR